MGPFSMIKLWIALGGTLTLAEFLLPGLVSIFIGLGALTVALGLHLGYISTMTQQLFTWFSTSVLYVFTLRLLVIRLTPSDTKKVNISEDDAIIGQAVKVTKAIPPGGEGRIVHSGTSWAARTAAATQTTIVAGAHVKVVGRDNITWIVKQI